MTSSCSVPHCESTVRFTKKQNTAEQRVLLIFFPRKPSLSPTSQSKHKVFQWMIVDSTSQVSNLDKSTMRWLLHLSVSLSPALMHINSQQCFKVTEKGQNLPSTSNWNVPTEILLSLWTEPGIPIRCCIRVLQTVLLLNLKKQFFKILISLPQLLHYLCFF